MATRSLFVAIVGEPNVGKSVLVNRLVGSKITAVSNKYNTTRHRVLGIHTQDATQLVYCDTPGLLDASSPSGYRYVKPLVTAAADAIPNADVVAFVADVGAPWGSMSVRCMGQALEMAAECSAAPVLVLNKVDRLSRDKKALHAACSDISHDFEQLAFHVGLMDEEGFDAPSTPQPFHTAGLHGLGVTPLSEFFMSLAPERPWTFPASTASDMTPQQSVMEIVREKLFRNLHKEVPYKAKQEIRVWSLDGDGVLHVDIDVTVASKNHARMLVGRDAHTIKSVAKSATRDMEHLLKCPIRLVLHVRAAKKHDRMRLDE